MIPLMAGVTGTVACLGIAQALIAARLTANFASRDRTSQVSAPSVTVLKPLHGDEPQLEDALETFCLQDYPKWQIICGVQDSDDPAAVIVNRLRARYPGRDIALIVDPALHGSNRKVGNLINMIPAAKHDVLVIADSDVHVRPDYLRRLAAALEQPGVGLVTTLYAGLPAWTNWISRLGATQITHCFLPSAILARAVGRQDCLGATMCLRRRELDRIGGFQALADNLADDNVLGRRVAALGLRVALADTVPLTTVPETTLRALFRHELRWARTIRTLEPAGFAASVLQYPLAWALSAILLSCGAPWAIGLFATAWMLRALAALWINQALSPLWDRDDKAALAFSCPVWLLPVRDILSVVVMVASYGGRGVVWRGHAMHADSPAHRPATLRPLEGTNSR